MTQSHASLNVYEEEFLRGDQKPCWCCANNLKTAALLVAIGILYTHCIVAFILLTFYVIDFNDKETLEASKMYRIALLIGAGASLLYIPLGFCLLIGIIKNRIWMCSIWFWVILAGSIANFGMWVIDQTVQLIVFDMVFLIARFYMLYVIWAYISVAKKQRRLQEAWENITKASVSAVSVVTPKEDEDEELGEGDSRLALGEIDAEDDLSHDSVMERIRASDATVPKDKNVNIKFKSLNQ